jgi:hypothetical protein
MLELGNLEWIRRMILLFIYLFILMNDSTISCAETQR